MPVIENPNGVLRKPQLFLDTNDLDSLEDQLMELPAKYANPILSWLMSRVQNQSGKSFEEVQMIFVDTDRVDLPVDAVARKFVKLIDARTNKKRKRVTTKL
jgi:hypothetical protein